MGYRWDDTFPGRQQSYVARASLRTGGTIGCSDGAVSLYNMKNYDGAVLHTDKDRTVIGIELVNGRSDAKVMKLVHRKGDTYISAKPWIQWSRIPMASETQRYELQRDVESGYLIIELGKPIAKKQRGST